jgi:putative oxidoreductase
VSRPFPLARWSPELLSVLRIVAAALFMSHGTVKLFGFPLAEGKEAMQLAVGSLPWIAGVLEVFGGALLLIGLFTRPVAFLLSGEMAVAYFKAHAPNGSWPTINGGEAAVLFCFIWLYFAAAGPGPWSVDAARNRGADPVRSP